MLFTNELLFAILGGSTLLFGGSLVGCLVWFAQRIVNKLDRLEDLVKDEFHQMDVRVAKLEAWRDGFIERTHGDPKRE